MNGPVGLVTTATLASHGATLPAATILKPPERILHRVIPAAFAARTMLGVVFLGRLPHTLAQQILPRTLGDIIGIFVLEHLLLWRRCHDEQCAVHQRTA